MLGSVALGLLLCLLCSACVLAVLRARRAARVDPLATNNPMSPYEKARLARLVDAEERVRALEKRATATADKVDRLVSCLQSQPLTRATTSMAAQPTPPLNPAALPPLALAATPRPGADAPAPRIGDVVRAPSSRALPPIGAAAERDADLSHSYGGKPVTYDVWRSGPVPPSWAPPTLDQPAE